MQLFHVIIRSACVRVKAAYVYFSITGIPSSRLYVEYRCIRLYSNENVLRCVHENLRSSYPLKSSRYRALYPRTDREFFEYYSSWKLYEQIGIEHKLRVCELSAKFNHSLAVGKITYASQCIAVSVRECIRQFAKVIYNKISFVNCTRQYTRIRILYSVFFLCVLLDIL